MFRRKPGSSGPGSAPLGILILILVVSQAPLAGLAATDDPHPSHMQHALLSPSWTGTGGVNVAGYVPGPESERAISRRDESVDDSERASDALPAVQSGEPTPTPRPRRTPTPGRGYDEVVGLPTVAPAEPAGAGAKTPAASLTPTVRPTATLAPTIGQEGMVAIVIGPDGGSLENPAGAKVSIPAGAIDREATLSIQPVANTKLPIVAEVALIPDTGFDIALAGEDGRAISSLSREAIIRIAVGAERIQDGARIYRVNGILLEAVEPSTIDGTSVVARTTSFSRFVVGIPAPQAASGRTLLPLVLAAGVALIVMVGLVVIGTALRPRRARSVGVRRAPPRTRYR